MKHLALSVSIASAFALVGLAAGCDNGGDGTIAGCATAYAGTLEGDGDPIPLTAQLDFQGELVFEVDPEAIGRELDGESTVSEDGTVTSESATLAIDGVIDLDTCEGSGDWDSVLAELSGGTWTLSTR